MQKMHDVAEGMGNYFLNVRLAEVEDEPLKTWAGMNMSVKTNMEPFSLPSGGHLTLTVVSDTSDLGRLEPLPHRIEAMVKAVEHPEWCCVHLDEATGETKSAFGNSAHFAEELCRLAEEDDHIVAITAKILNR